MEAKNLYDVFDEFCFVGCSWAYSADEAIRSVIGTSTAHERAYYSAHIARDFGPSWLAESREPGAPYIEPFNHNLVR